MKTSETIAKISDALLKAQSKIKHAIKDAKNPHFKNNYATLESVIDASKDALTENGIIVLQSPSSDVLTTRLQHSSGEYFESELKLLLSKNDMQGLGSAITYARRYALASMLNIAQADDDGQQAVVKNTSVDIKKDEYVPVKKTLEQKVKDISENKDLGDYVVKFGKKLAGQKLKDIDAFQLGSYLDYLENGAKTSGKALSGDALELYNFANQYLKKDTENIPF